MSRILVATFSIIVTLALHSSAQPLSSFNLAYQYNPAGPIQFKYRLVSAGDGYEVFFNLTLPTYDSLSNYKFSTFYRTSYTDSSSFEASPLPWSAIKDTTAYPNLAGSLTIQPTAGQNILVVQISRPGTQKSFFYDIRLQEGNMFAPDRILPMKKGGSPLLDNHFSPRDSLALQVPEGTQLFGFFYEMDFEEAKPPMVIDSASVVRSMAIDSTFVAPSGSFEARRFGLYLFQTDSSSGSALALRMTPFYYPKFVSIDEVIAPLRYITSREEYGKLVSSNTRKKALDNFLLDVSGSQSRAKRIMQNYFARVAEANALFTGFKEGWKTDTGMIYIIFGHPDVVERNDLGEVWTYLKMEDKSELKLEFLRVKNIFTPGYLTLVRKDDYDRYWFRFVDLWRKGRI